MSIMRRSDNSGELTQVRLFLYIKADGCLSIQMLEDWSCRMRPS